MVSSLVDTFTGTGNTTIREPVRGYPCRCGKVHIGEYAQDDWMMHECLHETDLCFFDSEGIAQVICPICGQTWGIDKIDV